MRLLTSILATVFLLGLAAPLLAADEKLEPARAATKEAATAAEAEHEGLPPAAPVVFHVGKLPVTNSMLVTWVVALGIIIFAQLATRNMKAVPEGAQNFWEWLVEGLYNFLEGIVGPDLVKRTF